MNVKNFIQGARAKTGQDKLEDQVVLKFLHILEHSEIEEVSCAEMYARLDEFVEREVSQKDAGRIMPLLRDHLDLCSDCCVEYEALLAVLENTK